MQSGPGTAVAKGIYNSAILVTLRNLIRRPDQIGRPEIKPADDVGTLTAAAALSQSNTEQSHYELLMNGCLGLYPLSQIRYFLPWACMVSKSMCERSSDL